MVEQLIMNKAKTLNDLWRITGMEPDKQKPRSSLQKTKLNDKENSFILS